MNKILSVLTLFTLLLVTNHFSIAMPANLSMLSDVNIATSVDNTDIKLKFNGKPGHENILYRDDFIQIELSGAYTDPPKQWLKVEDDIVKNIFVYQYDTNTVRLRLFTYGKAANLRERIRISRANNTLMISYGQKPAGATKKTPLAANVNVKNDLRKNNAQHAEVDLPKTINEVLPPVDNDQNTGSDEFANNAAGNNDTALTGQSSEEAGSELIKAESMPGNKVIEEDKSELMKAPPSFTGSVIKMVTALGIVLSLLFGVVYIAKKYLGKKIGLSGQEQKIRVVTSTYLGPKKSIALVEVAGEKIVVGVTATHISMLTKIGRDEDFGDVLKEQINTVSTNERVELQDELWEKV